MCIYLRDIVTERFISQIISFVFIVVQFLRVLLEGLIGKVRDYKFLAVLLEGLFEKVEGYSEFQNL